MNFSNVSYNLPHFSSIKLDKIQKKIQKKITDCHNIIDQMVSKNNIISWDDLYYPLMIAENELQLIWSPIVHLNATKHDSILRSIYDSNLLAILEYKNRVAHHHGLYKLYQKLRGNHFYSGLNNIQKTVLNKILVNYESSGIFLSHDKKKYYTSIINRLSNLSTQYANNVLDATFGWKKLITNKDILSGIPAYILKRAYIKAQSNQQIGWLFTLEDSNYSSILLYCNNSDLREEFYWAFNTRASDQGPNKGKWDNSMIMSEILSLRYELARILGFNSYFEKSLITKMAQHPTQVFKFLMNLFNHFNNNANREFLELQSFARKYYSCKVLKPWDIAFYQEKKKKHLFSITQIELKNFFLEKKILCGMFTVAHYIYGITIKQRFDIDAWHPDVLFFDVFDINNQWKGGFYLDLYQRINKYEGAWVDIYANKMYSIDTKSYQRPIVYLTCNFSPPENSQVSSFLMHNDVVTLFHEFGHVLHHILTSIDIPDISGINGVPDDVVEIPSQFMEKFCWDPYVLQLISMHYYTKKSLSEDMIKNILQLKTYHASIHLLKQVVYGLFDFKIHHEYNSKKNINIQKIFNDIIQKTSIYCYDDSINRDRLPNTFTHIFSDDYAAGYYGYLWSDVLASHIWAHLKKSGILNIQTGRFLLKKLFDLSLLTNLEQCFDKILECPVTTQSIIQYYGISVGNNNFFKLI